MEKKGFKVSVLSVLLGSLMVPTIGQAAVVGSADSTINASVTAGGAVDGPTEELITDKPINNNSNFLIKGVSDFSFSVPIGEKRAATVKDNTEGKAYSQGIEVADLRGLGTGWTVKVKMESLNLVSEGTHKGEALKGWKLVIPKGTIKTKSSSTDANDLPVAFAVTLADTTNAHKVYEAEANKGLGRYTNVFEDRTTVTDKSTTRSTGVQLSVPISARKGDYAGTLKWSLYDAPGA